MKCELTWNDGLKKISETKRPGMVIIHKITCSACNQLRPKLLGSKEIDRLSNSFVVISLSDDKEPEQKMDFDGKYYPRIFFVNPSGQVMREMKSPEVNMKFKYYYSNEKSLIQSMEKQNYERNMKFDVNLNAGLKRMRKFGQAGMVIIYKSWCPVCTELKATLISSREINYLSNYIVMVFLNDDDEPEGSDYAPDGDYIPRIFFLAPNGRIIYEIYNKKGDPQYKYFYTTEKSLVLNIRKVINYFAKDD